MPPSAYRDQAEEVAANGVSPRHTTNVAKGHGSGQESRSTARVVAPSVIVMDITIHQSSFPHRPGRVGRVLTRCARLRGARRRQPGHLALDHRRPGRPAGSRHRAAAAGVRSEHQRGREATISNCGQGNYAGVNLATPDVDAAFNEIRPKASTSCGNRSISRMGCAAALFAILPAT